VVALALYLIAGILVVLIPVVTCAKYLQWREWDTDRRIARLRERGQGPGLFMHLASVEKRLAADEGRAPEGWAWTEGMDAPRAIDFERVP